MLPAGELSNWALIGCRVHLGLWRVTKVMEDTGSWTFDLEMGREDARCVQVSWQISQIPLLNVFKWGEVAFLWLISEPDSIIYGSVDKAFSIRGPTNHV